MADLRPDDVAALCDHAGIDVSRYRDFATQRKTEVASPAAEPASSETPAPLANETQHAATDEITVAVVADSGHSQPSPPVPTGNLQNPTPAPERPAYDEPRANPGTSNLLELPVSVLRSFGAQTPPSPVGNPRIAHERWPAIQDLFSPDLAESANSMAAHNLPPGSISIFGVGGGVGKSTIAATIARVLTGIGESILLVSVLTAASQRSART